MNGIRALAIPIIGLVLSLAGGSVRDEKSAASLLGFDVLALPGRPVTLAAKLTRDAVLGLRPHVRGEEVVFLLVERELGRSRTADEGIATLEWTPPGSGREAIGEREIRALLPPDSTFASPAAILRVFVRDPAKPALVVDLDGTVCDASGLEVITKAPADLPAFDGSAEALQVLAKHYDIVYLTARDESFVARSREWLDRKGFPHGPIVPRDLNLFTLSAERFKKGQLRRLGADFHLVAGIGDRKDDAVAYLDAGLIAILVGDEDDVPKGARKLVTWAEVVRILRP